MLILKRVRHFGVVTILASTPLVPLAAQAPHSAPPGPGGTVTDVHPNDQASLSGTKSIDWIGRLFLRWQQGRHGGQC